MIVREKKKIKGPVVRAMSQSRTPKEKSQNPKDYTNEPENAFDHPEASFKKIKNKDVSDANKDHDWLKKQF